MKTQELTDEQRLEKLYEVVEDAFNYFGFRLEELKTDDKYYIEALMQYIEHLECKVDKLSKQLRK